MSLSSLPPEVLHEILVYLPISTLLAFSRTSKENFITSTLALQTLHLAVLPRRIYGVLAFLNSLHLDDDESLDAYDDCPSLHQITIPSELPIQFVESSKQPGCQKSRIPTLTPAQYRDQLFALQNQLAWSVLSASVFSKIQTLSLHLYELTSPNLTSLLATSFDSLRSLHLNFSHPYLSDTCLPAHYWTSPIFLKGSPIWNPLVGLGDLHAASLQLRTLETLTVERAGITSVQLRKWIEHNPQLSQLTLRNVLGVDHDFVQWLGQYYASNRACRDDRSSERTKSIQSPARLEKLALEHCSALTLKSKADFSWLDSLFNLNLNPSSSHHEIPEFDTAYIANPKCLEVLSLLGSNPSAVYANQLLTYLEEGKPLVKRVTLPDGRVLVAKTPHQQHKILARQRGLHTHGTPARNASTRSLNDVEVSVDDGSGSDYDDDDNSDSEIDPCSERKPGSVSFLCEKKSLSVWKGRWSAMTSNHNNNAGENVDTVQPFMPGNGTIEVDERHIASPAEHDDNSRMLRPVVRRMRSR